MSYITTEGVNGFTLFLVDRSKQKKKWWTYDHMEAMQFRNEFAAKIQARKLSYNNPKVISKSDAEYLSDINEDLLITVG